jgi:hypothetical protein
MAFERHAALYGCPRLINSDRGGNWLGLKDDVEKQREAIEKALNHIQGTWPLTRWTLNPARSPRFGGHYEVMCKGAKTAMKKILPMHRLLNDEEFLTIVKRAESYLNSRPLNIPSCDPSDEAPLTPNDFLKSGNRFRQMIPSHVENDVVRFGGEIRSLMKQMWKHFETELVTGFHGLKENKPEMEQRLKQGDAVYIITTQPNVDATKRTYPGHIQSVLGRYRVGRILQVQPGLDGVTRKYIVKHGPFIKGKPQVTCMSYMNVVPAENLDSF